MQQPTLSQWAEHLRTLADGGAAEARADDSGFADELGHRRRIDGPLLAWRARRRFDAALSLPDLDPAREPDVALWCALASGADPSPALARSSLAAGVGGPKGVGGLFPQDGYDALEVWSEVELASLHALSWLAGRWPGIAELRDAAVAWHLEHLQPDNATNHPWAVHVFLLADGAVGAPGAGRLHAETLLSNCQVALGRPDRFSAVILADAADALASLAGVARGGQRRKSISR